MAEPASTAVGGLLGVKYAALVAGFAGGVVSLAYMRELSRAQMVLAVLTGSLVAGYMTPIAVPLLGQLAGINAAPTVENAAAFLLGLTAMNIIPGVIKLSEFFRRDPFAAIRKGGDQ